ncbi:MAG: acetyltransferase [Chitinophagaceae bacterium]|nr:acetyltransferase [Chitinophagaceae bacterium]
MDTTFFLIGAGGHAKVIIEIIEEMGGRIAGLSDDNKAINSLHDYPVNENAPQDAQIILAIGNNAGRKRLAEEMNNSFGTAIHPKATLSGRCSVGEGTVIMAGATINSSTTIGKHCIINTNASVDHDCVIKDFAHISPNAALAGNVTVGEGAQVGIGSAVMQGICVGDWAIVGAGAVVIEDVPDYAVVVGVPARVIRYTKDQ